jgi:hypothetical protein
MLEMAMIGAELAAQFPKDQFAHQSFGDDNFLTSVTVPPDVEDFFGTFTYNIFVVQKPYGWERTEGSKRRFNWPPLGLTETLARYLEVAPKFASIITVFYIDIWSAEQFVAENPGSDLVNMLRRTGQEIELMCQGSEYLYFGGYLESAVGPEFFYEAVANHFGNPSYRKP